MKQYIIWNGGAHEYLKSFHPLRFKFSDGFVGSDAFLFKNKESAEKALCIIKKKIFQRGKRSLPKRGRINARLCLLDEIDAFFQVKEVYVSKSIDF